MRTILDTIIAYKEREVRLQKAHIPAKQLEKLPLFQRSTYSARAWLKGSETSGIIAEFKRKSPTRGIINDSTKITAVAQTYFDAGVSAISILTDTHFFMGSLADLAMVRQAVNCPLLRKDFIIDAYQILAAKAYGADFILLIAAVLHPEKLKTLAKFARTLALEVLMEIHNANELATHLNDYVHIVGVNNRNLKTFEVSLATSIELAEKIPSTVVKISESGISTVEDISMLRNIGYNGFLIGEKFMKTNNPGATCRRFIKQCATYTGS